MSKDELEDGVLDDDMYQSGFSVESPGYHEETSNENIDILTELNLLKHSNLKIDWLEYVEYDNDDIKLGENSIEFRFVAGKFKLVLVLKEATDKYAEKVQEIKGKQKTHIVLKWLMQSDHKVALLSEAEWTQLVIPDLKLKVSISREGYVSVAVYDSKKAYYDVEKKKRKSMRNDAEVVLNNLVSQTTSRKESAYAKEVDEDGLNEYDREVIGQAVELLQSYKIDCSELEIRFA